MRISVRLATAAHASTLAGLNWRWRVDERGHTATDRAGFVAAFTRWVHEHRDTHLPFLVDVDGQPAGMAWLTLADRVPTPERPTRPTGDVQSVYVRADLRGQGVGTALLDAVLREAAARGLEFVTVHSSERRCRSTRRHGYTDRHTWLEWRPATGPA